MNQLENGYGQATTKAQGYICFMTQTLDFGNAIIFQARLTIQSILLHHSQLMQSVLLSKMDGLHYGAKQRQEVA